MSITTACSPRQFVPRETLSAKIDPDAPPARHGAESCAVALANLRTRVEELKDRLHPVLTPDAPVPSDKAMPVVGGAVSPLALMLRAQEDELRQMTLDLDRLISRLEV